jgi:hypothetical protein
MSKRDIQLFCRGLLIKLSTAAQIAAFVVLIMGYIATECGAFGGALRCIIAGLFLFGVAMFIEKLLY